MKKIILTLLVVLTWLPYLFLATSIEESEEGHRAFDCTVKSAGVISQAVSLGAVYYSPIRDKAYLAGEQKILPYFFQKGEVFYAKCDNEEFTIGYAGFLKINEKIHVYTSSRTAKIFGIKLFKEEGIHMFGTGWDSNKEGETVLIRLVDDKEVKFFHGKRIKE